jgi:myo-inositol catabolism protein IolC
VSSVPRYWLRFDHRVPFSKGLFGVPEDQAPSAEQRAQISDLKLVIYEALLESIDAGVPREAVVAVLDENFSANIARQAKAAGVPLAISVEKSGRDEFEFEYGDDFAQHVEAFDPEYVKALARYNPAGDAAVNARQRERLASLSRWAAEQGHALVFELLIPPTRAQLDQAGGDQVAYERTILPELVFQTIAELQDAGVEAPVWMVPGLNTPTEYECAVTLVHRDGRENVACIVLGQGPNAARVIEWLRQAGEIAGYDGLALAQTIWLPPLKKMLAGTLDRAATRARIATAFRDAIAVYEAGAPRRVSR